MNCLLITLSRLAKVRCGRQLKSFFWPWVHVCCVQFTWFSAGDHEDILSIRFDLLSAYFDSQETPLERPTRKSLTTACALVFATWMLHYRISHYVSMRFMHPMTMWGRTGLSQHIGPFLTMPRSSFSRVWNAVLDHDFDPIKEKSGTNNRDVILFHVDFIGKFDLVSKVS